MATENTLNHNTKLTNVDAFIHIVKTTFGGGFLAMPEAFRHVGIVIGCFGTLIIGSAVLNMMSYLVRCSQTLRSGKYAAIIAADRKKRGKGNASTATDDPNEMWLPPMEYPETVEAVFRYGARGRFAGWAPFARNLCIHTLLITYYGVNIIYVCIIANTFKQLVDQYPSEDNMLYDVSIRYYPAIVSLVVIPIGMVSNLKALVVISKVANGFICGGALIIAYFLFYGDDRPAVSEAKMIVMPITKWSLFAGTALCSLEGVGMLMKIENNMAKPKELAGPPSYTLHKSMIIIILVNTLLGVIGYLRYGENVLGSISLNLPTNNCLADAVKVMVAIGILLSYGLQLNVTADLVWPLTRDMVNKIKTGFLDVELKLNVELTSEQSADTTVQRNLRRLKCLNFFMRFMLIIGTIVVATIEPRIEPLISLVGSVGFSILGLIMPVLMETIWYWYPEDDEDDDVNNGQNDQVNAEEFGNPPNADIGCWNINAPLYSIGMSSLWATVSGIAVVTTGTRTGVVVNNSSKGKSVKRFVRHSKNVVILALAVFALIGGTVYNVQQILNGISNGNTKPIM